MGGFVNTKHRVVTRRGVMWLGQTCNIRCYFCYFLDKIEEKQHPEHAFMPLEKAKAMCKTLVDYYGNNSIDIQGGEPTIWGPIHDLVEYCAKIGLKPTLITNGIVLSKKDKCQRLKDAGVYDLLFSLQGVGDLYDEIVGLPGGSAKQMKALENLRDVGIPFRFNCVLSKPGLRQLNAITDLAFQTGARVVNFIAFNPFVDQAAGGKRSAKNVASDSEILHYLTPVLDRFDERGVEVNVRYLPFCVFEERHRKFVANFQQIVFDLHEWDAASETWTSLPESRQAALALAPPVDLMEVIWQRRLRWFRESAHARAKTLGVDFVEGAGQRLEGALRKWSGVVNHGGNGGNGGTGQVGGSRAMPLVVARSVERGLQWAREHLRGDVALSADEAVKREARILMTKTVHPYAKCDACRRCDLSSICDGFHCDYGDIFGTSEFRAVKLGRRVTDPKEYMKDQMKVVEDEEADWALPSQARATPVGRDSSAGR